MKLTAVLLTLIFFFSCTNDSKGPDVSHIKVEVPIERFDKSFFSLDTNNLSNGLRELMKSHPDFYVDFMQQILGVSGSDTNQLTLDVSKRFINGYYPIYQELNKKYNDAGSIQNDLEHAFQYVKYYFS